MQIGSKGAVAIAAELLLAQSLGAMPCLRNPARLYLLCVSLCNLTVKHLQQRVPGGGGLFETSVEAKTMHPLAVCLWALHFDTILEQSSRCSVAIELCNSTLQSLHGRT